MQSDESPDVELAALFRRDLQQIEVLPRASWRPQQTARVAPSWFGPALLTTAVLIGAVVGGGWLRSLRTPVATAPIASASVNPKDQTPPAGYTPPPGPQRYPARTSAELLAGMATDPFLTGGTGRFDTSALGTPVLVRALRSTDLDVWLVPAKSGGAYAVSLDRDGLTRGTVIAGTSSQVPVPPLSEADARTIARSILADVARAELVWVQLDPRSGFFADQFSPLWRLAAADGTTAFVLSDRRLLSAAEMARLVG